jgi:hypothetical protein
MKEIERPVFSEILDWLEGRLPPAEAARMAERMAAAAPEAKADEAWLRRFLEARQAAAAPPVRVRDHLRQQFKEYVQGKRPGLFKRLQAVLQLDSGWQMAAVGLRSGGGDASQRHLIYNSPLADIALSLQPAQIAEHFIVYGQVFPHGDGVPEGMSIQLLQDAVEVDLAVPDELGEFTLREIAWGEYDLVVSMDGGEVIIADLSFRL